MGGQEAAILLVGLSHVIAVVVLLWVLLRSGDQPLGLGWWFGEDDRGDEPGPPPEPIAPGRAALPLRSSRPATVRLRGPERLADAHPPRPRRPEHVPQPDRTPHG